MLNGIFNFGGKNESDISSENEVASKVVEPKVDRKNLIVVDADRSHEYVFFDNDTQQNINVLSFSTQQ